MKTIDEDIATGQFQKVYLLYGDEDYLKLQYKNKLLAALTTPGDTMNFSSYEGEGISVGELIDLAETLPFFAERRVSQLYTSNVIELKFILFHCSLYLIHI